MRSVKGRVVVAENGVGLPDLVVAVFVVGDVQLTGPGATHDDDNRDRRLGSVLTDDRGAFEIRYEAADRKPLNLRLAVFADGSSSGLEDALYVEPGIRTAAGQVESYLVRIAQDRIGQAKLAVPAREGERPALEAEQRAMRGRLVDDAKKRVTSASADRLRQPRAAQQKARQALRAALTARGRTVPGPPPGRVADRLRAAVRRSIEQRVKGSRVRVRVPVTGEQRQAIHNAAGEDGRIPAPIVLPLLLGSAPAPERVYASPLLVSCRDQTWPEEKCGDADDDAADDGPGGDGSDAGNGTSTRSIPDAVWSVLESGTAVPDSTRTTPDDIARGVGALALANGPADVPAFFDFPSIQIAFEDVWAEAFDEDLLATAMDLYRTVVELGGEVPVDADPQDLMAVLRHEAILVLSNAPPGDEALSGGVTHDHRTNEPVTSRYGENADSAYARLAALFKELEDRLAEPYRFTVFAADETGTSVNFGLVVTYRQKWLPLANQAGRLVETVTLAPREERTYSVKRVDQQRRKTDTTERFKQLLKSESTDTARDIHDLVATAQRRTGFQAGYAKTFSASFNTESSTSSQETRQNFREAVLRAAQEMEAERQVAVSLEQATETTTESTGKLANPNDELSVTYLFYELFRRFRISEKIHKVTPVVLVAQPVPAPHEITVAWLIQHDWILRRVLLDPSFQTALAYLSESLAGDELATEVLRQNVDDQRALVQSIQDNLVLLRKESSERYLALQLAMGGEVSAAVLASNPMLKKALEFLGADNLSPEAIRLQEDMARDAYERAMRAERELSDRLGREVSILQGMTDRLLEAQKRMLDRKVEITRLRLHVKQNILYYMQAIWDHEPPDQRYFRLHQVEVPRLRGELEYQLVTDPDALPMPPSWEPPETLEVTATLEDPDERVPLVEVADLDRPLGYKGNYMILPLRVSNVLTDYMMAPYVDARAGARDPDDLGNFTISELDDYVCCLKKGMPAEDFQTLLPGIHAAYQALLSNPRPSEEEVVIPTGSLLMAELPGVHPVIEDFKLRSRAMEVIKTASEIRRGELDNLRRAARILADDLSDPDIERIVQVQGTPNVVVGDG